MPTAPPVPRLLGAARVAIVLSALAAPAVHAVLATHQPAIPWMTAAGMALGIAGGMMAPGWTLAALVAIAPVWQAVIGVVTGQTDIQLVMPWLAAMAGCLAVAAPSRWRAGAIWAVPLSAWALVIALTWPVAMLRELDFATAALHRPRRRSVAPRRRAGDSRRRGPARRAALLRLAGSAPPTTTAGGCGAGCRWPSAWSVRWRCGRRPSNPALLSRRPWIGLGRAAGGFYDANATGRWRRCSGRCSPAASSRRRRPPGGARRSGRCSRWRRCSPRARARSMAAWATASAVGVGVDGPAVVAHRGGRRSRRGRGDRHRRGAAGTGRRGPVRRRRAARRHRADDAGRRRQRTRQRVVVPRRLRAGVDRESSPSGPGWGIGPGVFGTVVGHYSPPELGFVLPADNAQNWWRHQWAELGLIGALPAFVCSLLAMAAGLRAWRSPAPAWALPVLGLGVLSLVSPPVQHPFLQVLVALLIAGAATAADAAPGATRRPASALWGPIVWVAAVACAAGLAVDGWTTFRPAYRAVRVQAPLRLRVQPRRPPPAGERAAGRRRGQSACSRRRQVASWCMRMTLPHERPAQPGRSRVTIADRHGVVCAEQVSSPDAVRMPGAGRAGPVDGRAARRRSPLGSRRRAGAGGVRVGPLRTEASELGPDRARDRRQRR